MGTKSNVLGSLLLAAMLACAAGTACVHHHYYRVYDPYYSDYHVWGPDEVTYYHEWAREHHYDEHRDFRSLPPEQQKEYWTWRHSRNDHGHDRDNDHH